MLVLDIGGYTADYHLHCPETPECQPVTAPIDSAELERLVVAILKKRPAQAARPVPAPEEPWDTGDNSAMAAQDLSEELGGELDADALAAIARSLASLGG